MYRAAKINKICAPFHMFGVPTGPDISSKPIPDNMENPNDEIGRIRQILFGHNVSEIEKRIEGFEQQMQTQLDKIDMQLTLLNDGIAGTQRQLDELKASLEEKSRQVEQQEIRLKQNISSVSEQLDAEIRKIRQMISDTTEDLRNVHAQSIGQQTASLTQLRDQITSKLSLLQSSKVDRTAMALLLNELALRLGTSDTTDADRNDKDE